MSMKFMSLIPGVLIFIFALKCDLAFANQASPKVIDIYTGEDSVLSEIAWAQLLAVSKRLGGNYQWRLVRVPTERALRSAGDGGGLLVRSPHLSRKFPKQTRNLIKVPQPLIATKLVAYARKHLKKYSGFASLKLYYNGVERGIKMLESIPNAVFFRTIGQGFAMLEKERLDTVICFEDKGDQHLKKLGNKNIVKLNPPLKLVQGFPYLHKDLEALVKPLSNEIQKAWQDGTFDKIVPGRAIDE